MGGPRYTERTGGHRPASSPVHARPSIANGPLIFMRVPIRPFRPALSALVLAPVALVLTCAPLAAQGSPGTFNLPPTSATPTPAPAGPADERAGVAIPPRAIPEPRALPQPTPAPVPSPSAAPLRLPDIAPTRAPNAAQPSPAPRTTPAPAPSASPDALPDAAPLSDTPPQPAADAAAGPGFSEALPSLADDTGANAPADSAAPTDGPPEWWPYAVGGAGLLALIALAAAGLRRRRHPAALRLAPPAPQTEAEPGPGESPRLDLDLVILSATRSVMMVTFEYRLTLSNRTGRAVRDLNASLQLVCARRDAANAAPPGASQTLERVDRVGPHQSRSLTGRLQLPINQIVPLLQGNKPLFVPLVHVTLEGEGQRALTRSFVVGNPSTSVQGRVHPIALDGPPGGIPGLRAAPIDLPSVPPAAAA